MMVRPHLARRVLNVIAGSLLVVLLFSAAGALMTYLSMVMLSPTTVAGFQLDPTAGVIILALASLLAWLLTRPIKRITGMLSYAATGNPHQLSEQRRRAMAGLGRLTPLPRWRRGRSHRVSDPQENPTDPVTPTEPARPSRPEQVTIVRRRTTTPAAGPARPPARHPHRCPASRRPRPSPGSHRPPPARHRRSAGGPPPSRPGSSRSSLPRTGNATRSTAGPAGTATEQRPAAGHLHRQVWNGRGWVLADDDRVFRPQPAPTGRSPRRADDTGGVPATGPAALGRPRPTRNPHHPLAQHRRRPEEDPMNARDAWRWPLRSRGRLIALVLAGLALALITKTILDTGASTAAPAAGATGAPAIETDHDRDDHSRPRCRPTRTSASRNGPRDPTGTPASTGSTATPRPPSRPATGPQDPSTPPVVIGVPVTTTVDGDGSGYVPEADQAAALDVTARFVDAWYAGGSDQAWRDQVSRWADPTLAKQLPSTDRDAAARQPAHHRAGDARLPTRPGQHRRRHRRRLPRPHRDLHRRRLARRHRRPPKRR